MVNNMTGILNESKLYSPFDNKFSNSNGKKIDHGNKW